MMAAPQSHTGRRILVVDDDRAMVRTLCDVLKLAGWEPVGAFSGEEATDRIEQTPFTAVLMDVRMGGISGVDALRTMRAHAPALPVVLMTAYASPAVLEQAATWGATRVLNKPVPIPELLQVLKSVSPSRGTLLIVDDDPQFLRSLASLLEGRGFAVHQASSLERALERLRESTPAVVLLDLKLGTVAPMQALEGIRSARPDAAIILCSGHPELVHEVTSAETAARVVGYVIKPVAPDQLTALLDAAIG